MEIKQSRSQEVDVKRLAEKIQKACQEEGNGKGWTPLAFWANKGDLEIVKALLDKKAEVDAVTVEGLTPLHYASQNGFEDIVLLLIQHGADINYEGIRFSTALMRASNEGHIDVVRVLLECGANVNYEGQTGDTALMNSIVGGHFDIFKLLINSGADINYEGLRGRGFTPLMSATFHQREEMVAYLISRHCRINQVSRRGGWTAKALAKKVVNQNILAQLEKAPQDSSLDWPVIRKKLVNALFLYTPITCLILICIVIYVLFTPDSHR
eukprot:Sdes_comp21552_c0_seq1m20166